MPSQSEGTILSAQPQADRPLLRVFAPQPPGDATSEWTVRAAFDEYVAPELGHVAQSTRDDCERYLRYWEQYEQIVSRPPSHSAHSPQPVDPQAARTRMAHPSARDGGWESPIRASIPLSKINTKLVTAYRDWIHSDDGLALGPSSANKAFKLLVRIMACAGDDGIAVPTIRTKSLPTPAAPKHYIDDEEVNRLWDAAELQNWPGPDPVTYWRAILILFRTYGMRVQDLVSYEAGKQPLTWSGITLAPRTPDPDGRADWHLGWLHYVASKTGRQYYLPLTPAARGAIDRLRAIAVQSLDCDWSEVPADRPILPCARGRSLGDNWRLLQAAARVRNKAGKPYILEDFRKTVGTYLAEHNSDLPYLVCGWSVAKSAVASKHYIHAERTLVKYLPTAPMPERFSQWHPPA